MGQIQQRRFDILAESGFAGGQRLGLKVCLGASGSSYRVPRAGKWQNAYSSGAIRFQFGFEIGPVEGEQSHTVARRQVRRCGNLLHQLQKAGAGLFGLVLPDEVSRLVPGGMEWKRGVVIPLRAPFYSDQTMVVACDGPRRILRRSGEQR